MWREDTARKRVQVAERLVGDMRVTQVLESLVARLPLGVQRVLQSPQPGSVRQPRKWRLKRDIFSGVGQRCVLSHHAHPVRQSRSVQPLTPWDSVTVGTSCP